MLVVDKFAAMTTFVRIVEKGSLTAAANVLDTSLPSVVRILATLERELGVSLLYRTTRRIHLTDEGAQYLDRCRSILSEVHDAEADLTSRQVDPQGRLTVTASVLFGRRYVAPIVSAFIQRHQNVNVEMLFVDRVVNIVDEGIDVAIRIGHLGDSSLVAIPVGEVRRVVCASPRYLRRHGIPGKPQDVRTHRCIRHVGLSPRNEWNFRVGRRLIGVQINCAIVSNEIDSTLAACTTGLGLGMFLSYQTAPYRKADKIRYVLEDFETDPVPVQIVYPHTRRLSTTVRAFVDECVSKLRRVSLD
jgi:DNA-binding transcriptional LysR family regulator